MEILQAYSVEQIVYFESQTDRVLIYVEFTAVVVLKYMGILSLDWDLDQAALVRAAWLGSTLFAYGNMIYLILH